MATTMSGPDVAPLDVQAPRRRSWMLVAVVGVMAFVVGAGVALALGQSTDDDPGSDISDAAMVAWATADPEDIAAIYAEDAVFIFDGEPLAAGLGEITDMIGDVENTYETVGSVSSCEAADGDLYVSALVEVVGPGHPLGDPVVVLYRVHDGKVIRHVVMDAEHY
jgi:ketosteroid isomerase-like protein